MYIQAGHLQVDRIGHVPNYRFIKYKLIVLNLHTLLKGSVLLELKNLYLGIGTSQLHKRFFRTFQDKCIVLRTDRWMLI